MSGPACEPVEIVAASEDDLPALADLLHELFTLESDFRPERRKQLAGLRLILRQPELGRLFVLRVDGRVAGMASILLTISTAEGRRVGLIEDVIVAPAHRRRGHARRLLEHLFAWAREAGLPRLTLLAEAGNAPAQALYDVLGFTTSSMNVRRKPL